MTFPPKLDLSFRPAGINEAGGRYKGTFAKGGGRILFAAALLLVASCASLPDTSGREKSFAYHETGQTRVARVARQFSAGHPGKTGVHALARGTDALTARLALADMADRTLDVQYYIWRSDATGSLLVAKLWQAAERGVRVRMLLDDIGTMASDEGLEALDSHPNIEVRLFNPVALRTRKMLGALLDFRRVNRRMHNKTFIADNQAAIVGGRNIGDEYFDVHDETNFADFDVLTVGAVVRDVSIQFDAYWNSPSAIGISGLSSGGGKPSARRAEFVAKHTRPKESSALEAAMRNPLYAQVCRGDIPFIPARARVVYDAPEKISAEIDDRATHLAPKLKSVVDGTRTVLLVVSPYFIPEERGVELFRELTSRGVRVVILTNSLASNDVPAVHAAYKGYRKPLLHSGVEIYELKPDFRKSRTGQGAAAVTGTSRATLHAKTFLFDQRVVFIGSMNLDPRSLRLNTEVGVLIDCPQLASMMARNALLGLDRNAYEVRLEGRRLVWVAKEDGREVRHASEPETSAWQRLKTGLLGWLPVEGQL